MSLYFSIQSIGLTTMKPERTYVLMSFARTTGCLVYLTGTGLIGVKCFNQGKEMVSEQVTGWPRADFDLLKGTHKATLLFSVDPTLPVRLYVDGMSVLTIINPKFLDHSWKWDLTQASPSLQLFGDRFFWEYYGMWGVMKRFSLQVSNNIKSLMDLAETIMLEEVVPLEADGENKYVSSSLRLETTWENCQPLLNEETQLIDAVTCDIIPMKYGMRVPIEPSLLHLACSRPLCEISFTNEDYKPADIFSVTYRPHYPLNFNSENVGSPPPFPDPSFVTDGWSRHVISFKLNFHKDATLLETGANLGHQSALQIRDAVKYVMVESAPMPHIIERLQDDEEMTS
eukprot:TRINITY_DN7247_c0_g1_i3.p1 TRINITY_DN7247_c0_g1~~TRINITY_DN7247_c0_g1_i3.p1  ORF type:complete len:342 (-),score=73.60 TRINITY_DN7247_c0_g1_i3:60-1085(-)